MRARSCWKWSQKTRLLSKTPARSETQRWLCGWHASAFPEALVVFSPGCTVSRSARHPNPTNYSLARHCLLWGNRQKRGVVSGWWTLMDVPASLVISGQNSLLAKPAAAHSPKLARPTCIQKRGRWKSRFSREPCKGSSYKRTSEQGFSKLPTSFRRKWPPLHAPYCQSYQWPWPPELSVSFGFPCIGIWSRFSLWEWLCLRHFTNEGL